MSETPPRRRVHSGAPWEAQVGYCRAIQAGNHISVSGTAPVAEDGSVHAPGDGYEQAKRCLQIALAALAELDADASHVVRTRMFVTDILTRPSYAEMVGATKQSLALQTRIERCYLNSSSPLA